jgi:hypothetical protein
MSLELMLSFIIEICQRKENIRNIKYFEYFLNNFRNKNLIKD